MNVRVCMRTYMGSVFLLVLGAYTLHTCLRERLRNASATARGAYARTFVSCRAYADAYARKSRAAFFQLELCNLTQMQMM